MEQVTKRTFEILVERTVIQSSGPHKIVVEMLGTVEASDTEEARTVAANKWRIPPHKLFPRIKQQEIIVTPPPASDLKARRRWRENSALECTEYAFPGGNTLIRVWKYPRGYYGRVYMKVGITKRVGPECTVQKTRYEAAMAAIALLNERGWDY